MKYYIKLGLYTKFQIKIIPVNSLDIVIKSLLQLGFVLIYYYYYFGGFSEILTSLLRSDRVDFFELCERMSHHPSNFE